MRITPTPRAVSPQDIVRIYVPPPPPEELYDRPSDLRLTTSSEGRSPESDCRTIIQRTPTELPGSVSTATITSQSMRSLQEQRRRSQEERPIIVSTNTSGLEGTLRDLALYSSQNSLAGMGSTSSSRRGSMSRKSSILVDSELAADCPHIRISGGSRKNSLQQRHSIGESANDVIAEVVQYEAILARANNNKPKKQPRIMTSFEKLAQMNDTFYFGGAVGAETGGGGDAATGMNSSSRNGERGKGIDQVKKHQQSDEEAFSYSFQAMRSSGGVVESVRGTGGVSGGRGDRGGRNGSVKSGSGSMERTKCTSDYNITYKSREDNEETRNRSATRDGENHDRSGERKGKRGTAKEQSHYHHGDVKEMMKNKKQYDRFFTPDESEEDDEDEEINSAGGVVGGLIVQKKTKREFRQSPESTGGKKCSSKKSATPANHHNSSSGSSVSSPQESKSLLVTPVNETQPLIMTEDEENTVVVSSGHLYNFRHSRGVQQQVSRRRAKQLLQTDEDEEGDEGDADEDGYEEEETDDYVTAETKGTPASSPTYAGGVGVFGKGGSGGAYYPHRTSSYIPISEEGGGMDNKIRIRVNEKNK